MLTLLVAGGRIESEKEEGIHEIRFTWKSLEELKRNPVDYLKMKMQQTYVGVDLAKEGEDKTAVTKFEDDVLSILTDEEIRELKIRGFHDIR